MLRCRVFRGSGGDLRSDLAHRQMNNLPAAVGDLRAKLGISIGSFDRVRLLRGRDRNVEMTYSFRQVFHAVAEW